MLLNVFNILRFLILLFSVNAQPLSLTQKHLKWQILGQCGRMFEIFVGLWDSPVSHI